MIHVFSPSWRNQEGTVIWITNTSSNTKNTNTTQQEKKGPTTEEGKRKQAEAQATKREKEERRRERNRKKREAYRSRQREKTWTAGSKRSQWTKGGGGGKEERKEKKNKTKEKKRLDGDATKKKWRKPKNEEDWESAMTKALKKQSYDRMKKLFSLSLHWAVARGEGAARRGVTKQFRVLSIRFHPDKHPEQGESFKVAFQALNEAHGEVKALVWADSA